MMMMMMTLGRHLGDRAGSVAAGGHAAARGARRGDGARVRRDLPARELPRAARAGGGQEAVVMMMMDDDDDDMRGSRSRGVIVASVKVFVSYQ